MAVFAVSSSQFLTIILAFALASAFHTSSPPGLEEATKSGGFSVELIHRDSPKSPLHNASETPSQRLAKSLLRSLHRVQYFSSLINGDETNPYTTLKYNSSGKIGHDYSGEYLVKVRFGSPVVETHLIFDTSSSLIWTQCIGCTNCIRLDIPAFDPSASPDYNNVACESHSCNSFKNTCSEQICRYSVWYGDGSTHTFGVLGQDDLKVPSVGRGILTFENVVFGCGYDNEVFFYGNVSGILGMGNGFTSFPTQLRYLTGPKFSYCFVPSYNVPGRLSFGDAALITGRNVVSTPLILNDSDNLYRFTLEAISVGATRVELGDSSRVGNMVIDSSTVPTLLPVDTYRSLEDKVRKIINATELEPPLGESLAELCYPSGVNLPGVPLTMHLAGADLRLKLSDMFMKYSAGIACLAFGPSRDKNVLIYGNWAQLNFQVGFDVDAKTLSFKPSDCTAR